MWLCFAAFDQCRTDVNAVERRAADRCRGARRIRRSPFTPHARASLSYVTGVDHTPEWRTYRGGTNATISVASRPTNPGIDVSPTITTRFPIRA